MKLSSFSLLILAVALPLSVSHGQQCTPTQGYSVYFVLEAWAKTHTVNPAREESFPKANDRECYVDQKSALGHKEVTANGETAKFSSFYSYSVTPQNVTLTTEITGEMKTKSCPTSRTGGSCGGDASSHGTVGWQDTIMLHTNSKRVITESDIRNGHGPTEADKFNVTAVLKEQDKDCKNRGGKEYLFTSGVFGGLWLMPPGSDNQVRNSVRGVLTYVNLGGNVYPTELNVCNIEKDVGSLEALNGFPLRLNVGVSSNSAGTEDDPSGQATSGTEYEVHVRRGGLSLCIRHPKTPADLTMTSASGASYWCEPAKQEPPAPPF